MSRSGRFIIYSTLLMLTGLTVVHAEDERQDPQSQQPETTTPPPKPPPPPLFPRHHRGIHRDAQGLDVVDATPQSPPLETDDPSVPDNGEYEINFTALGDFSRHEQGFDLLRVDANYGILPGISGHELPTQIKFEFPLAAARTDGEPFTLGIGPVKLGLKFNFYIDDRKGLSLSTYPQVEFSPSVTGAVEKGLAPPGQTFILPLLVSKELHYFTFVANAAVEKHFHDPEQTITGAYSVAFGRAVTRKTAAMVELRGESSFSSGGERLMFINVGVISDIRDVVVYGKLGHSIAPSDDLSHTYIGFGAKMLIQTRKTK